MPKGLVIGGIAAVALLIALMTWLNNRSLSDNEEPASNAPAASAPANPQAQPAAPMQPAAAAQGPVVLTATAPAWIQVTDQGRSLFEGMLQPGQSYTVPPTATAPMLKAGKPEALTVTVGTVTAPPVGPAGKVATASLLPTDLLRRGQAAAAPAPAAAPAVAPAPKPRPRVRRPAAAAPPPAEPPPPPTTNSGQ
jgi:hypothetical protein